MKRLIGVFIVFLLIAGCQNANVVNETSLSPTMVGTTLTETKKNISFEVTSFTMDYEDTTQSESLYTSERYSGKGLITAVGDETLVKLPYDVLIEIKKVSGGSREGNNEGPRLVVVNNGIGNFTTYDSIFEKNAIRMQKPIYEIKIIGYIPYIPVVQKIKTP